MRGIDGTYGSLENNIDFGATCIEQLGALARTPSPQVGSGALLA